MLKEQKFHRSLMINSFVNFSLLESNYNLSEPIIITVSKDGYWPLLSSFYGFITMKLYLLFLELDHIIYSFFFTFCHAVLFASSICIIVLGESVQNFNAHNFILSSWIRVWRQRSKMCTFACIKRPIIPQTYNQSFCLIIPRLFVCLFLAWYLFSC